MRLALQTGMGVKQLEDLVAYQLSVEFKKQIYALVRAHPEANRDLRYRSQLFEAVASMEANIAQGWRRFAAGEVAQFFRFALASLEEAKVRLIDGAHRGYFSEEQCAPILTIGRRCGAATMAFWRSQQPFTKPRKSR
jgi:four helix bundle protein